MTVAVAATDLDADTAPRRTPFDRVVIVMHWATVFLVFGLFALAIAIGRTSDAALASRLLIAHRSFGVTVWLLTCARLTWRQTRAQFPPFPGTMSTAQRRAAQTSEFGLYALLLLQPITGFTQAVFRGKPFGLFFWRISPMVGYDRNIASLLHRAHEWGAWMLAAIVGLHAAAALLHAFVLRDGVFWSMAPVGPGPQKK